MNNPEAEAKRQGLSLESLRMGAVEYRQAAMERGAALVGDPGYVERTLATNLIAVID